MALSCRGFLAVQGAAAGAVLVPGRLLTALEADTDAEVDQALLRTSIA